MNSLITCNYVSKTYKNNKVLNDINFSIEPGEIVGLIGPNGAGKTTLMKVLLGLTHHDGEVTIIGKSPHKDRAPILEQVSFIADTAILPSWISVRQCLDYVGGIHPRFNKEKALQILATTNISLKSKVRQLSKGMVTQLHLLLIMAIDTKILILDEPTLGLDIMYRKSFYQQLLTDYFDHDKTIIITTHQVEEIENILTRVIFLNHGEIVLNEPVEELITRFSQVTIPEKNVETVNGHIYQSIGLNGTTLMFDKSICHAPEETEAYPASLTDIFVAFMSQDNANNKSNNKPLTSQGAE